MQPLPVPMHFTTGIIYIKVCCSFSIQYTCFVLLYATSLFLFKCAEDEVETVALESDLRAEGIVECALP
jgi:hypothetical protein